MNKKDRSALFAALAIAAMAACTPARTVPSLSYAAVNGGVVRAAVLPTQTPPDIDRRYIAAAALGMKPIKERPVVSVTSFGAKGNGTADDTVAIQRAFDRVPAGDVLLFPAGTYRHSNVLVMRKTDVVVEGRGATLQATSPQNESLVVAGNKIAIVDMTIDGTGTTRLTTPASTDIQVTGRYAQLVGNKIFGGSSAGIFMYGARDYRVTGNTVANTLADGIHSTNVSRRGLVEGNTVFQTGDDTIAVVSYTGEAPSGNILINDNHVSDNPNGRGITCVGCMDVAIVNNEISGVACCAGVLVANEIETIGVEGVLIANNDISNIELHPCCGGRTSQGGVDINSVATYAIEYVSVERNRIANVAYDGIRTLDYGTGPGVIDHINLYRNSIAQVGSVGGVAIDFVADPRQPALTTCWQNTYDGKRYTVPPGVCAKEAVTSAAWPQFDFIDPEGMTWAPDGRSRGRPWR
jgi:parallel beta-helix repeat protein